MIGGTMTSAEGVLFDLPSSDLSDGEATSLVVLVMAMPNAGETYVFFDDARYSLGSDISVSAFAEHLTDRVSKSDEKTLLVLSDRTVTCEQLIRMAAVSRKCGLERILFANKRAGDVAE
jgi:biopolymer transport protein ExbD